MSGEPQGLRAADAFVSFGISGDLARKMTFISLYQLERRGLLDTPIIGVAAEDWSDEDLRQRAAESVTAALGDERVDEAVLGRLQQRMSYVGGDVAEPSRERCGQAAEECTKEMTRSAARWQWRMRWASRNQRRVVRVSGCAKPITRA